VPIDPKIIENVVKYGILILTAPIWWPILKALYGELQAALWREGGLFGAAPNRREVERLEEQYRHYASPMVNQTLAEHREEQRRQKEERKQRGRRGAQEDGDRGRRSGAKRAGGSGGTGGGRPLRTVRGGSGGGLRRAGGGSARPASTGRVTRRARGF